MTSPVQYWVRIRKAPPPRRFPTIDHSPDIWTHFEMFARSATFYMDQYIENLRSVQEISADHRTIQDAYDVKNSSIVARVTPSGHYTGMKVARDNLIKDLLGMDLSLNDIQETHGGSAWSASLAAFGFGVIAYQAWLLPKSLGAIWNVIPVASLGVGSLGQARNWTMSYCSHRINKLLDEAWGWKWDMWTLDEASKRKLDGLLWAYRYARLGYFSIKMNGSTVSYIYYSCVNSY
ncbi:hypothetical protein RRF57_007727 [Xylaria bambusicola]|uniref:Uncharacterized protein n=1 Tax=Xylaria bambusicola TaxID=326684 RepID=A0AAN7USG1_9PEZI